MSDKLIYCFCFSSQNNIHKYQIMNKDREKIFEIVDENWITQQIK